MAPNFFTLDIGFVLLVGLLLLAVWQIGHRMATPSDSWLGAVVMGGFLVKLLGSWARWWVLVDVYAGQGDATGYHRRGETLSEAWRNFEVPVIQGLSAGTRFVWWAVSVIYTPYRPNMLGGFFMFAFIAFLGQLLMYAAFRRSFPETRWKLYAFAVLYAPSLVFWPSSIGKEALMFLFLGMAVYGVARLFERYRPAWIFVIVLGLLGAGGIRVHMAALVVGSAAVAILWTKTPAEKGAGGRRIAIAIVGLAAVAFTALLTASTFNISVTSDEIDVDPFFDRLERTTGRGGSAVEGRPIQTPADLPQGVLRVLYRPLPHEATNVQAFISSLESTVLLAISIFRFPAVMRALLRARQHPYYIFCFVFTMGFIVAFSTFLNLGLMARQRSQVLPFLLVLLIAPGGTKAEEREVDKRPTRRPSALDYPKPVDVEVA